MDYREEDEDFFKLLKETHPELFPTRVEIPEGQVLENVHPANNCEGRGCVIHHPSDHKMKNWPKHFVNFGVGVHAERFCQHRVAHPDPDDVAFYESVGVDITPHECDGCCAVHVERIYGY